MKSAAKGGGTEVGSFAQGHRTSKGWSSFDRLASGDGMKGETISPFGVNPTVLVRFTRLPSR